MRFRIAIILFACLSVTSPAVATANLDVTNLRALAESQLNFQAQALVNGTTQDSELLFPNISNRDAWINHYEELIKYSNRLNNDSVSVSTANAILTNCSISYQVGGGWLDCKKTFELTFVTSDQTSSTIQYQTNIRIGWKEANAELQLVSLKVSASNPQELLPVDDVTFTAATLSGARPRALLASGPTYLTSAQKLLVVTYALTWALDYNGAYDIYPETDCANFASQAMFAGGWRKVGDLQSWQIYDRDYWNFAWPSYATTSYATHTWINANELFQFTTVNALRGLHFATYDKDVAASHQTELFPGDLVFVRWDTNATPVQKNHVAVVTNRGNGIVKISSHTTARRNLPFSTWIDYADEYPNARYFFVRT